MRNSIQPRGFLSAFGGFDGQWLRRRCIHCVEVGGNPNVLYLNRNDSKRKLNYNWFDNDWNDNYRFVFVRNSLYVI